MSEGSWRREARWATYRDRHRALGSRSRGRERRTPFSVARGRVAEPGVGTGAGGMGGGEHGSPATTAGPAASDSVPSPSPRLFRTRCCPSPAAAGPAAPDSRSHGPQRTPGAEGAARRSSGPAAPPPPGTGRARHSALTSAARETYRSSPRPPIRQVFAEQASGPEPPERPAPEQEALTSPEPGSAPPAARARPPATHSPGPC